MRSINLCGQNRSPRTRRLWKRGAVYLGHEKEMNKLKQCLVNRLASKSARLICCSGKRETGVTQNTGGVSHHSARMSTRAGCTRNEFHNPRRRPSEASVPTSAKTRVQGVTQCQCQLRTDHRVKDPYLTPIHPCPHFLHTPISQPLHIPHCFVAEDY